MKRYSYGERDYTFGQAMLTLRTALGLTQAGLADLLGVSRRAVTEWEAGSSYPKTEHLKEFLTLCVQQQAFPAGREAGRSAPSGTPPIRSCSWMKPGSRRCSVGHVLR